MRKALILAPLLLAGCVNDSASYFIDGNEHTLTVRAQQDWFWEDEVTLKLVASRLPDCQRQLVLGKVPAKGLNVELLATGQDAYLLRAGSQAWQVETRGCTQMAATGSAEGRLLGTFRLDGEKMVFEQAGEASAAAQ